MLDFSLSLRRTDANRLRIATSCTRQDARARVCAHPACMEGGGRECAVRRSLGATCALPAGRRRAGAAPSEREGASVACRGETTPTIIDGVP